MTDKDRDEAVPARHAGESGRRKGRGIGIYCLKLAVAAALISWVLRDTHLGDVRAAASSANIWLLATALAARFFGIYISVTRWKLLLRAQGVLTSARHLYPSFLVGMFFNNFLPTNIGGDTYRSYANWRLGAAKTPAVVVTIVERFLGLLALLLFALLALLFAAPIAEILPINRIWFVAAGAAALLIGSLVVGSGAWAKCAANGLGSPMPRVLRRLVTTLLDTLLRFRGRNHVLVKAFGVSLLVQVNAIIAYYILARAIDIPIGVADFFLIVPIATVVMVIPVSINAIGVRENVFAFLMALYGVALPTALAFAWLAFGLDALQGLVGGVIYAFRRESSSAAEPASTTHPAATKTGPGPADDAGRIAGRTAPSYRPRDLRPALTAEASTRD